MKRNLIWLTIAASLIGLTAMADDSLPPQAPPQAEAFEVDQRDLLIQQLYVANMVLIDENRKLREFGAKVLEAYESEAAKKTCGLFVQGKGNQQ